MRKTRFQDSPWGLGVGQPLKFINDLQFVFFVTVFCDKSWDGYDNIF